MNLFLSSATAFQWKSNTNGDVILKIFTTSRDDYLKALLVLQKKMGNVRSADIAQYLGVSRPSVCHAVSKLTARGYINMDENYFLKFTKNGLTVAEKMLERYRFFSEQLIKIGVDEKTAQEDACRLEHAISDESFEKLKNKLNA